MLFQKERENHYKENPGTGPRGKPRPVRNIGPFFQAVDFVLAGCQNLVQRGFYVVRADFPETRQTFLLE